MICPKQAKRELCGGPAARRNVRGRYSFQPQAELAEEQPKREPLRGERSSLSAFERWDTRSGTNCSR